MSEMASPDTASSQSALALVPASDFSLQNLVEAYNQTRVDYLVPMPMNAQRLAAYLKWYDVDLRHSWVAMDGRAILGLALLGVRPGRSWVTRLGVLPAQRRGGTGAALVRALLDSTRRLHSSFSILEVIQRNQPAHALFLKLGFRNLRSLLVLRRPADRSAEAARGEACWLDAQAALDLAARYPERLPWTNEVESYRNAGDAAAVQVDLGERGQGWLVYRRQPDLLSHFLFHSQGDAHSVARALLAHLYQRYPQLPASVENIAADDPHLPALMATGFEEAFRRTEMLCVVPP